MRSRILNEKTSWTEPLPWLPRDKTPWVVPGELVNIIFVLMSGFVNVVDIPNKSKGETDRFFLQFFTLPAVKLGIAGGQ